jgi:hypothetical protein
MPRRHAWSPSEGPDATRQQVPTRCSSHYAGDGATERAREGGLWAPSEGPVRSDPGGPGGEPDGHTISKPGLNALNEP